MQVVKKQRARTFEDKQLKRRKLLDAARRLFSENGYPSTSIEMITEASGYGTGTFYTYFSSKTEIFRVLYGEGIEILHEQVKEAVSWPGMSVSARLSAIASTYTRFFREHRDYFDILSILHLKQRDFDEVNEMVDHLNELAAALLQTIQGVIEQGVEQGEMVTMDPWKATCFLWGMIDGIMLLEQRRNLEFTGLELEDVIKQGLEIVFFGMFRSGGKR
jgi:AcrR family transcriptional regulator